MLTGAKTEQSSGLRLLGARSVARERALQIEWVRRRVYATHPSCAATLARVLSLLGDDPELMTEILAHPWTGAWLRVAVGLVERHSPDLLPDGHVRAHLSSAVNLVAAAAWPDAGRVRFDGSANAWLPGTGLVLRADRGRAGRQLDVGAGQLPEGVVVVDLRVPGTRLEIWPDTDNLNGTVDAEVGQRLLELDRTAVLIPPGIAADAVDDALLIEVGPMSSGADRLEAAFADAIQQDDGWPTPARAAPGRVAASGEALSVDPRVAATIERWVASGGALATRADHRTCHTGASPALTRVLGIVGVEAEIPVNRQVDDQLRRDVTIDHLSLLSVRDPESFELIEAEAAEGVDVVARRITAHCSYIRRRFDEAADGYAALLIEVPDDLDLWRDLCWSLRHGGREAAVRGWILEAALVVAVAVAVDWTGPAAGPFGARPAHGSPPVERSVALLEWIADDLG